MEELAARRSRLPPRKALARRGKRKQERPEDAMSRSWHRLSLFQEETRTSAGNQVWGEERDERLPRKEAWSICFSCFVLQKKRGNKPPNGTWKVPETKKNF